MSKKKTCFNCKNAIPIEIWQTECICKAEKGHQVDKNCFVVNARCVSACDKWEKIQ